MPGILEVITAELAKKSVSTGIDYFRGLIAQAGGNVELRTSILELQQSFLDMRDENARLRDLLHDAQRTLKLQDGLVQKYGAYFKGLDTDQIGGPYCTRCWEVDRNTCTLVETWSRANRRNEWLCQQCHCYYEIPSAYSTGLSTGPALIAGLGAEIKNQREED